VCPSCSDTTFGETLLMEQLKYNLLFRWFVGLEIDDPIWNQAVFSKNRDRLLKQDLAQRFFAQVKAQVIGLMSDEHFTVDGTLIEAWAEQKSFRRKDDDKDGAEVEEIFTASRAAIEPTPQAQIPRPDSIRSQRARQPS